MDRQEIIAARLAELARLSETDRGVTRLPWTDQHRATLDRLSEWMEEAGLTTRLDSAGTLIGRSPGPEDRPVLFLGSHQDSVREGGAYDGIMGVILAIEAARALRDDHADLPITLELLAFADEEGVRFPTALLGPRALAGTFDAAALDLTDRDGKSMAVAMRSFGLDPEGIPDLARDPDSVKGYLECHIEQGPVLEREDLAAGIVTAICGISRSTIEIEGETGHAGTVPMAGRRDALVTAARSIDRIDRIDRAARDRHELRATVGRIEVAPGVVNAIPAHASLMLEIRAPDDRAREAFEAKAAKLVEAAASETGCAATIARTYEQSAVTCDAALQQHMAHAMEDLGLAPFHLPSGATHDASAMADICPVAMLFLRCRGGISHHPDEGAAPADMALGAEILARTIRRVAGM